MAPKAKKSIRLDAELSDMLAALVENIRPKTTETAIIEEGIRMAIEKYGKPFGIQPKK